MPVLAELEPMVARVNRLRDEEAAGLPLPLTDRREQIHRGMSQRLAAVALPAPPGGVREDHVVAVDGGEVRVRVYRPGASSVTLPVHVYVHGGGWWLGTLDHRDQVCGWRAANVDCVVVSVEHRLAPEHRFPVPVHDVYAALEWVVEHAAQLGVDPARTSIGGDSSGANLAAAAALLSRDRRGPALVAQVLEIPALDLTMSLPSVTENATGYLLTRQDLAADIDRYCDAGQRRDPLASPALAPDLAGLPPALVMTAEYDVVRDDGELYADRLNAAGVEAEAIRWAGHVHGSHEMTATVASARDWQARVETFLRQHLHAPG